MIIISRIISALLLALVGYRAGQVEELRDALPAPLDSVVRFGGLALLGLLVGWLSGATIGRMMQRLLRRVRHSLEQRSGEELVVGTAGLVVGLVVSYLMSLPVRRLDLVGIYLLLPMTLIVSYVFAEIALIKHEEILRLIGVRENKDQPGVAGKLLDSSVLIDGRIRDVVEAGFIEGELVVPLFVLEELQQVADSSSDLKRARGRRGLDVVRELRRQHLLSTPTEDVPEATGVDAKLVRMAIAHGYVILTTDFNLAKVAQIQQVKVLNINELANAMKPAFVPGETFDLRVLKPGKEDGQGVGYLDDGTMVIVEQGASMIGETVPVEVTSVLQSPAGRLVFTRKGSQ